MKRTHIELSIWKIRSVYIRPSIKWDKIYSHNELGQIMDKLKAELPQLSINIFKDYGYCNEVDGRWNVAISVQDILKKTDNSKNPTYMYLIR